MLLCVNSSCLRMREGAFCWKQKQRMSLFVTPAILGMSELMPDDRYAGHKGQEQGLGMSELFCLQVLHCGKGVLQFH